MPTDVDPVATGSSSAFEVEVEANRLLKSTPGRRNGSTFVPVLRRSKSSRSASEPSREVPPPGIIDHLRQEIALRDLAIDRIPQGLSVFNGKQRLQLFNHRYAEMYGIDPDHLWLGMTLQRVVELRYAAGTGPLMKPEEYTSWRERIANCGRGTDTEVTLRNGRKHLVHHEPLAGGGWVTTHEDVTERRRTEARVRHMALHDGLTDLPNRHAFVEQLDARLARLRGESRVEDHRPAVVTEGELVAVLFVDLDHFKDVNDTLGHVAGDMLLQLVAARIAGCLRAEDVLARLGGDEFAILLEGLADGEAASEIAQRIIEVVSAPFAVDGREVQVGASVGISLGRNNDADMLPAAVLRQADMALHRAKAEGRGTFSFFQSGMSADLERRKTLEWDLRRAVVEETLEVYFQPLVALAEQRIVGAEALVRWRHPEHGMVPPSEFIPLAEQAGLIGELGAWVLRTACARVLRWGELRLAVNLSPEQVRQAGLIEMVAATLAETGLPAGRLELEITEGVLLHDTAATLSTLSRLRQLGVGVSLDDFGTGFSSLSYLRRFPFSKLKIDRSFVIDMVGDAGAAAIVQAVTTLGRSLSMRVVAEGIETEEQLAILRGMGCDEVQGYLLGKPMPADAFGAMLAQKAWCCDSQRDESLDLSLIAAASTKAVAGRGL